jgi:outer membrane protein assembly factor BamB
VASENDNHLTFIDATDGKLYTQVGAGHFVALDADTGSVLWTFHDESLRVFTHPAFSSDALFVAATGSKLSSELIRLELATGKVEWRAPIEGLGGNASPVLCAGEVLVPDYWHKTVSAFEVLTGKKDWTTESQPFLFLFPPAILDDKALFLVADKSAPETKQQLMSVFCGDGRPEKTLPVRFEGVSRTPILLYNDSAVISGYDRVRGTTLKAIKLSDGAELWSASIPDEIARFTPVIQKNLLVSGAGSVWALDLQTGKMVFRVTLPTPSVPIAVASGLVFFSRSSETVEARELPSGRLRWKTKLQGRISSNIATLNNKIYVNASGNRLAVLNVTGHVDGYLQIGKPDARFVGASP